MKLTALCTAVLALAFASLGRASVSVALTPSAASPQPVGTRVIWIAQGASSGPGALDYRFRVRPAGGMFRIVRDFHPAPVFEWRHYENEGHYEIEVTARSKAAGQQSVSSAMFVLVSRASGLNAVVAPTGHPLVMLYSAPPCPAGMRIRAIFNTGTEPLANTPWKNCEADLSRNFLIAGLRPSTTYRVMHQLESNGSVTTTSAPIPFTTIGLPAWLPFPQASLVDPPERGACFAQPIVLHANLAFGANPVTMPIATDIFGRVMWYYPRFANEEQRGTTIFRPLPGGNMLMAANDSASALGLQQILREIDLTGSPVRETNVDRISEQLVALGHDPITSIHHDIVQLPNGRVIALASNERVLTDVQGPGDVAVIGDMLIELDEDLQVGWVWNGFDHLDAARLATLDETCVDGQGGCPPVLARIANDWLHSNSVSYTEDGNVLLSIRHQDWVVKIDYADGTGTGAVLWRLGEGGDFTVLSADPDPWFSHQHDAEFDTPGVPLLTVFDNGNVRRASDPNANSRGQAFYLDETRRLAIPVVNADLGAYAFALGNSERLCNGGFHFHAGVIQPELKAQAIEVGADGRIRQMLETPQPAYRTFRMRTMYQP